MHEAVEALCASLEKVGETISTASKDMTLATDATGVWTIPPLNAVQIANHPICIAAILRSNEWGELSTRDINILNMTRKSVDALLPSIVPNLTNGSANQALPPFVGTMAHVSVTVDYIFGTRIVPAKSKLPTQILRSIDATQRRVNAANAKVEDVDQKMKAIQSAYDAADELPATLSDLQNAKEEMASHASSSQQNLGVVIKEREVIESISESMKLMRDEADKIVEAVGASYRATTSKGLAASFEESAAKLSGSINWWVGGLVASLGIAAFIGYWRIEVINQVLLDPSASWFMIITKMTIALASVGPAIWFAWLATKQIGQRFRMAEDYNFKASVAKAYEGYRREAARIDPDFEAQLFSSALTRVDEAPLRLVEPHSYGSPMQEFSQEANKLDTIGKIREKVAAVVAPKAPIPKTKPISSDDED